MWGLLHLGSTLGPLFSRLLVCCIRNASQITLSKKGVNWKNTGVSQVIKRRACNQIVGRAGTQLSLTGNRNQGVKYVSTFPIRYLLLTNQPSQEGRLYKNMKTPKYGLLRRRGCYAMERGKGNGPWGLFFQKRHDGLGTASHWDLGQALEESRSGLSLASFAQGFREEDSLSFGFSFPFFFFPALRWWVL